MVSSSGSAGSISPRYASISVPALMPDHRVLTSTSPSPGADRSTGRTPTRRGSLNTTARPFPPCASSSSATGPILLRVSSEGNIGSGCPRRLVTVPLPTSAGVFEAQAFECASGSVYLALVKGDLDGGHEVATRVHSECLTGDALGSLRCDCGVQLQLGLRAIAAAGRGVLVYATGHEGRGADTLDANLALGLAVDAREYTDAAAVLQALGVRSVRLLTNNPGKVEGLRASGIDVVAVDP